jgi:GrpB-like predicted nucleotidyltransferase (UPF0157 family)
MAGMAGFDGKDEKTRRLLESLNNDSGVPKAFIDQLQSNPALMKEYMDLMASVEEQPYSKSGVSGSSPDMASIPHRPLPTDLLKSMNKAPYSSPHVSMSTLSSRSTDSSRAMDRDLKVPSYGSSSCSTDEKTRRLLESLNNDTGVPKAFMDQLQSNPALMKEYMDLLKSMNKTPYSSPRVSMSTSSSPITMHRDLKVPSYGSSSCSTGDGVLGALVALLVVIGVAVLGVVLILKFLF